MELLKDVRSVSCRYHGEHKCQEVELSSREMCHVIDSILSTVQETSNSCQQAINSVDDDERSFAAVMFHTTEQACVLYTPIHTTKVGLYCAWRQFW